MPETRRYSAGRLHHRVTLRRPAETSTARGEVSGFADVATVHAGVEPVARGEATERASGGDDVLSEREIEVTIRHRDDVAAGWRLVWDGREYRITSAIDPRPSHWNRWLVLACVRFKAD